jgi:FKBP-type peptidyl-prolyl cis-trans isomerase FklB
MKEMILILSTALLAPVCFAAEPPDLSSDNAKINYSVGYQIGGDFKLQGVEMEPELVIRGIQDALSGATPLMTPEDMRMTMGELGNRIAAERTREKYMAKIRAEKENLDFLITNAQKEGVKTTPSGLQYRVIEPGTGRTPKATDTVTVNYRGTLIDGKEFDSSYKRGKPATFRVDGVIAGWTEALQLMKEGAKWQVYIPQELAYGERGPLRDKTLIFDIDLLSINEPEPTAAVPGSDPAEPATTAAQPANAPAGSGTTAAQPATAPAD